MELEEQLFGDEVVFVDEFVHGDEEEVSVRLRAHCYIVYARLSVLEGQLVVVDFDAFDAFDADERTRSLVVLHVSCFNRIPKQNFL